MKHSCLKRLCPSACMVQLGGLRLQAHKALLNLGCGCGLGIRIVSGSIPSVRQDARSRIGAGLHRLMVYFQRPSGGYKDIIPKGSNTHCRRNVPAAMLGCLLGTLDLVTRDLRNWALCLCMACTYLGTLRLQNGQTASLRECARSRWGQICGHHLPVSDSSPEPRA